MSDLARLLNDVMMSGDFRQVTLTVCEDGRSFASIRRRDNRALPLSEMCAGSPAECLGAFLQQYAKPAFEDLGL